MRRCAMLATLMLALAACGGGGDGSAGGQPGDAASSEESPTGGGGGDVVNSQPPGQGYASVDGVEYTFDTPGAIPCETSDQEFGFSYVIGDSEVNLVGGAAFTGGQWFGSLSLRVVSDDGFTEYRALLVDNPQAVAVDGNSVSYSGPMESSDGTGDPVPVGDGIFSSTCG